MIDAGIWIVRCLDILVMQTENKTLKKGLQAVYEDVQKGFTISSAMKKHEKIFPNILTNMVEAGEVSGNLDEIMARMADHFEKENRLENKIKSAMIYPIVLIVVSIAVVIFMLVNVLPTFVSMFEGSGVELPWPTEFVRSEEHTSELQSRGHLVCRLLLEKKKINIQSQGIVHCPGACR